MPGGGVSGRHAAPCAFLGCDFARILLWVGYAAGMAETLHPIQMIDVGNKSVTLRTARASGCIRMQSATLAAIRGGRLAKGDPIATARLAGIMAAKRTADIIPLCHPLPLDGVDVELGLIEATEGTAAAVTIAARVRATARTGVEMEALAAVTAAALTIYDMTKAIDRTLVITDIQLDEKTGGSRGDYCRSASSAKPAG